MQCGMSYEVVVVVVGGLMPPGSLDMNIHESGDAKCQKLLVVDHGRGRVSSTRL